MDEHDIGPIVDLIRAAALAPERWSDVMAQLGRIIDGAYVALHGYDDQTGHAVGAVGQRFDPHYVDLFVKYYSAINPWNRGTAHLPVGVAHPTEAYAPREAVVGTVFYADWVQPQENIITGGGLTVFREQGRSLVLACNLRLQDQERLQAELLQVMNLLAPHLRESFAVRRTLRLTQANATLDALETVEPAAGLLVLDGEGRILRSNAAAEQLMRTAQLPVDGQGKFKPAGLAEAALARGLAGAAGPGAVPLAHRSGAAPFLLRIIPLPRGKAAPFDEIDVRGARAIAVLHDPEVPSQLNLDTAALLFELTPAEQRLAGALCEGASIDDYAAARRISRNTVRNQLRAVMQKTGTTRQGELIAKLVRLSK